MSQLVKELNEQKEKAKIDESDLLDIEFPSTRSLGITLKTLSECPKHAQVSVIN